MQTYSPEITPKPLRFHSVTATLAASNNMTSLIELLPKIDLESMSPQQRRGLSTTLDQLHSQIHEAKQRLAVLG